MPSSSSGLLEEVLSDSEELEELEELLFDSAGFSEVLGFSELSGADGPSPPLQPASIPDAATIAAPFIKSRRVTFRLMAFSSFLQNQLILCLKIHKISCGP